MQFSDETLMAYADGEADADTRRQIEAAMALDPTLAERVAKHRTLRADLGAAFGGVLDEPVPSRLIDAANSSPAIAHTSTEADLGGARAATVIDLNAARADKSSGRQSRTWSWPEWTAIAASLLIGVLAGRSALRPSQSEIFATSAGGIVATGDLSAALDDQLSGSENETVRIGLSFRSKDGNFCRSFAAGAAAGFACHEATQWRVRALNETGTHTTDGGEYRMAGSELPPAVLTAIEDIMEGEALDRQQELEARERGWNK